jgi:hypothetical protein
MRVTPTTAGLALLIAAGACLLWRKTTMSLARLNASIDLLTAAVDKVAERLAQTDTVPAADVDNAASRVEDQVIRINGLLETPPSNGGTEAPAARHK